MKRTLTASLVLAALLCLGGAAWAGGLSVSRDRLEFGNIKEGVKAEKTVTLKNTGQAPIKIANVSTSCSCTTTRLGKTELLPGEETELNIVYNTWKFPGKFEKYVNIFTGPEGRDQTVITMLGHVDPVPMGVVEVSPRKLSVGKLPLGGVKETGLTILNTGDAPLNVSRVYSKKHGTVYFDAAKTGAPLTIAPGQSSNLKLALCAKEAGRYLDYVIIEGEARNITENGYKVVVSGQAE